MVSIDLEPDTEEVLSPFLQCFDNGEKFFFVSRVILLSIVELVGIIHDGVRHFPSFSETQDGSHVAIASIGCDIYV